MMVSPIQWGIFHAVLALVVGVTLIYTTFYASRWLFCSLTAQIQIGFSAAAGLAGEDARLAKEYRTLLAAFSSFALERNPKGEAELDPTTLRCVSIVPDKEGLSVVFEGFEITRATAYSGFRLFYRGRDVTDARFRSGDHFVNLGDTLKLTYVVGEDVLMARVKGGKLAAEEDIEHPMFEPSLDVSLVQPDLVDPDEHD